MKYPNIIILLSLLLLVVPSVNVSGLDTKTLHYWTFDETSGTTLYDSIRTKNVTASNSDMLNQTGIINKSVHSTNDNTRNINFNGISDMKSMNFWVYNLGTGLTPIFWQDTTRLIHINDRWTSNQPVSTSLGIMASSGGVRAYGWTNTDLGLTNQYFPVNEWSMISIVWNNTDSNYYASVNNGSLVSATKYNTPGEVDSWSDFYFAKNTAGDNTNVRIDEFAIFNESITQEDIGILYNDGSGLQYPFSTEPEPEPTLINTTFRAKNNSTGSIIGGPYYFYLNGVEYLVSGTSRTLELNYSGLFDVNFSILGYNAYFESDVNFTNLSSYNASMILNATTPEPEPVNLTNVSFTAINSLNESIVGFSVSINDDDYFGSTSTDTLVLELPEDTINNTLYKLVYSKFGYYTSSYNDINLSSLVHEGTLVAKSYIGDESLDDKAIIWILLAITGGIGASSIFARPMLVVFGFWLLFMTYFLSNNIMVAYYWFAPLGYVLGAIVILTGMLRLGFGEKF